MFPVVKSQSNTHIPYPSLFIPFSEERHSSERPYLFCMFLLDTWQEPKSRMWSMVYRWFSVLNDFLKRSTTYRSRGLFSVILKSWCPLLCRQSSIGHGHSLTTMRNSRYGNNYLHSYESGLDTTQLPSNSTMDEAFTVAVVTALRVCE